MLRGLLITTVLVVLYYLLPLDRPWKPAPQLVCWLASWSSRASGMAGQKIVRSRYLALRAVDALALIAPLSLLLFASTYFVMERASAANFTQPLTPPTLLLH